LIGEIVLLDRVEVPRVNILHAELRQREDDARTGRTTPDNIDATCAEGVWFENTQMAKGVN